jgi:hypothetical protein
MTAVAQPAGPSEPHATSRLSPVLEQVILETVPSARAFDDLVARAERMHRSNIHHEPESCLVCFAGL